MGHTINHLDGEMPNNTSSLHSPESTDKILRMTADTMFLITKEGICIDLEIHTDRWFLQDKSYFINKNIFDIIPDETSKVLKTNFDKVVSTGKTITDNYEVRISGKSYFFKCIIYNYDDNHILFQYRDITQRILLKNKLEIMNNQLQDIEKVAGIGQWTLNSLSRELKITGYTGKLIKDGDTKNISLDKYMENIHPDDIPGFNNFISDCLDSKTDGYLLFRYRIETKLFFFKLKPISCYYENGAKIINGYVQNVTDIMEKQHELNMVTLAIENSTDYVFAMDPEGQLVFGNKKFKEYNGLDLREEISRVNFFEMNSHHSDIVRWQDIINQLKLSGRTINFVHPYPIPNKPEILAFDCTSYVVKDAKGIDLIWTFGKDITERVQYEKQVKELNQIMSTVLRNIPMSISVKDVDNDLKYIFSNNIGGDFHWGVQDAIIGKTDFDIFPKQIAERMREEDLATIQDSSENRKIFEARDESGTKQVWDQFRILVKDEFRPLLISIERDITKDKQMEQDLIHAKEKAEESDKLKSAFIANMSHEIRTPLNAIVGFSRIMADTQDMEERQTYYSIVESNNAKLLCLINEILDISKIESGIMEFNYESTNLFMLCNDLIQSTPMEDSEVKLVFDPSDQNLVIRCDKNRLTQVFNNLIGNAVKFTKHGKINFGYTQKNDRIEFYVKDTGTGIPTEKVDKVFERFVKADSFSQGTGLGLSICKSILEKMGGSISVSSVFGSGSCFTFNLPDSLIIQSNTSTGKKETDGENLSVKKAKILIAEDTDSNYVLLRAMLGNTHTLIRAKSGLEVVNLFEETHPDIILMDIKMPDMNGLEATEIIRSISKEVPIIAQSAFAYEEDRKKALAAGCSDFITKPFKKKQLLEIINRYL